MVHSSDEPLRVLSINAGSSSLKFALYSAENPPREVFRDTIEAAGTPQEVLDRLEASGARKNLAGVAQRLVHGGKKHSLPARVTPELVRDLERLIALDPTHLPKELALIAEFTKCWPEIPQFACFDTAFHRGLPTEARTIAIPRRYQEQGVDRYGFHGLSYEFLVEELTRTAGTAVSHGRVILAHLGSGASLAAVRDGQCIDTTMGFTPTAGLVMGTRSGDLDPGVLIYLMRTESRTADQLDRLVNQESGLLGISETTSDVRKLLANKAVDPRAAEAIAVFCYQARKYIGAMSAALDGVETLVFSGGIGENAPEIRGRICAGLAYLGVRLSTERNVLNAPIISAEDSPVTVRVIRTNEEAMLARHAFRLLAL
jgi:acetate kinase